MSGKQDVIIIGAGPGGYVAAIRAGQLGLKCTLIEKDNVLGGTCLHRGCIPSKVFLHQAHLFKEIANAEERGIITAEPSLDLAKMQAAKQKIIDNMAEGIKALMKTHGVEVMHGFGSVTPGKKVRVSLAGGGESILEADNIILATGSVARSLLGLEFDGERIVRNREILEIKELPESTVIIGGGAIGVEFATVLNSFGKEVVILEMLPQLLPIEDPEIAKELGRSFKKRKIKFHTDARVTKVEKTDSGVKVTYTRKDKEFEIEVEKVLVAVGRKPSTEDVGLEETGIKLDRGFVVVDERLRTTVPGIWAIGDIIPTPQLAHSASAEGIFVIESIAGNNPEPINFDHIPGATYSDPEVASVGLTEPKAIERGYEVKTGLFRFNALAKSHIVGCPEGLVKVVADAKTDRLLGLHIVGPASTELISEGTVALKLGATISQLTTVVHPHPTLSEVVQESFESVEGRAIHA